MIAYCDWSDAITCDCHIPGTFTATLIKTGRKLERWGMGMRQRKRQTETHMKTHIKINRKKYREVERQSDRQRQVDIEKDCEK